MIDHPDNNTAHSPVLLTTTKFLHTDEPTQQYQDHLQCIQQPIQNPQSFQHLQSMHKQQQRQQVQLIIPRLISILWIIYNLFKLLLILTKSMLCQP